MSNSSFVSYPYADPIIEKTCGNSNNSLAYSAIEDVRSTKDLMIESIWDVFNEGKKGFEDNLIEFYEKKDYVD